MYFDEFRALFRNNLRYLYFVLIKNLQARRQLTSEELQEVMLTRMSV